MPRGTAPHDQAGSPGLCIRSQCWPRRRAWRASPPPIAARHLRRLGRVVRCEDHVDALEFLDVGVAGRGQGAAQGPHEVEGTVGAVRGAGDDFTQGPDRPNLRAETTR